MSDSPRKLVDARVLVETPEGVDFQFRLAGPGLRAHAWLIDVLIRCGAIAVFGLLGLWIGWLGGENGLGAMAGLATIVVFLVSWFYGTVFECLMSGQTPGKRLLGLRVVRTNGTPVDVVSSAGRNFLRTADLLPFGYTVGLVSMLMTRRLQRLGDLFFDTMVIDERRRNLPVREQQAAGVEVLLRSECSGVFRVPERTLGVIERLFEKDREISEARREELARPLSEVLQRQLGWKSPGPDPKNPHTFFQGQSCRHTNFLRRVLKTFAEDAGDEVGAAGPRFSLRSVNRGSQTAGDGGNGSGLRSPKQEVRP